MKFKAYRIMLKPNNKQRTKLFQYAGASRFIYNWALEKELTSFKNDAGFINEKALRRELTSFIHNPEYSWLLDVSKTTLVQAIKDLCIAYGRFFELRKKSDYVPYSEAYINKCKYHNIPPNFYDSKGHPKFKRKKTLSNLKFYARYDRLQFTETHVKFEGFAKSSKRNKQKLNWVRLAEKSRIPVGVTYYNPRVSFDGLNWWLSVCVEDTLEIVHGLKTDGIGIDLGVNTLATCSNGVKYKNINRDSVIKKLEVKKRKLQRSIARQYLMNNKPGEFNKTANIIKAEKKLLKLNHRITNLRKDYQLHVIKDIIKREPSFICIEDLDVSDMLHNKKLSRVVQEQRFFLFRQQLKYQCKKKDIDLFVVNRFFPSSKLCNCCGEIKTDLCLWDRVYRCNSCGYVEDRDINAAKNLKDYALRYCVC